VFLGTSAVLGDYAAGSNHVLPTGGLARGTGGLGLEAFLKPVQLVSATPEAEASIRRTVEAFAALEGLPLHAESMAARA
jgi:histidinol dehydrogenase